MMTPSGFSKLALPVALVVSTAAIGQGRQPSVSIEDSVLKRATTAELAGYLLPLNLAARVTGHEIGTAMGGPWVVFSESMRPFEDGCIRTQHRVDLLTPQPERSADGSPVWKVGTHYSGSDVSLAPRCQVRPNSLFVAGQAPSNAFAMLRRLREAQQKARSGTRRIAFDCTGKMPVGPTDKCDGRRELAALDLLRVYQVRLDTAAGASVFTLKPGDTRELGSGMVWKIAINAEGAVRSVKLDYEAIAPF